MSKIRNYYLWKNSNFSTFSQVYFYSLESFPFYLEYHESTFLGLFCLTTSYQNTSIFGPKSWTNLFVKCLVCKFSWSVFLTSKEPILFYLECQESKFVGLLCLKTNCEDISVFWPKSWKNSNFPTLSQMFSYSLKCFLFYLEYRKSIFFWLISCLEVKTSKVAKPAQRTSEGVGDGEDGEKWGGWGLPVSLFWFYWFLLGKWRHRIDGKNLLFLIGKKDLAFLKDHLAMEAKVKKKFTKFILFKRYEVLKCPIFLKINNKNRGISAEF